MDLHEGAKGLHGTAPRSIEGGGAHRRPHGVIPAPTPPRRTAPHPRIVVSILGPRVRIPSLPFHEEPSIAAMALCCGHPKPAGTRRGMNGRFLNEPHALRDTVQACAVDKGEYDFCMKLVTGAMMIARVILTPFVLLVVVGIALGRGLLNRIR